MKVNRFTYLILFAALFGACGPEKPIPRVSTDAALKIFLDDPEYIDTLNTGDRGDFVDIQLNFLNSDSFRVSDRKRIYEIYFDKEFTTMAGRITIEAQDSIVNYQMYDHKGVLRMTSVFRDGSVYYGPIRYWNSNGKIERVNYYDQGRHASDSVFYENGNPRDVSIYRSRDTLFKEMEFYRDGNLKNETYYYRDARKNAGIDDRAFVIRYDSLSREPSMFYSNDSIYEDPHNPGIWICSPALIPVDKARLTGPKHYPL
jgi:antitoxin component YwqK of YwqJK toxin-antitoxin module